MKKILCVCEYGSNRSVHFASILKRSSDNFDVLSCGTLKNTPETLEMLYTWADVILLTDKELGKFISEKYNNKVKLYDVGADTYNRPYNPVLYEKVKLMLEVNPL